MIGTQNHRNPVLMTLSVSWLEVASHIVVLAFIMVLDGITNGNIAIPAVRMMQASVREESNAPRGFIDTCSQDGQQRQNHTQCRNSPQNWRVVELNQPCASFTSLLYSSGLEAA